MQPKVQLDEVSNVDARSIIRQLYDGHDGYRLSRNDKRRVARSGSSSMYGEMMPAATEQLLTFLKPTQADVVYDLGSGIGKWVLHAALTTPIKRSVGIELAHGRHQIALQAREQALQRGLERARFAEFVYGDLLRIDLSDATIVYSCSTSFPISIMECVVHRLRGHPPGTTLVSLQPIAPVPWLGQADVLLLDTSWKRRCKVNVYRRIGE